MKGLDRLVDVNRYRPHLEIQPEVPPRVERGRLNAQPDGGEERSGRRTCLGEQLDGRTDANGPFDADHCRFSELDVDVVVVSQRRPNDLFLHLTVERDEYLLPTVVLPHVDQGVLLGELGERDVQRAFVGGAAGNDDRFQRRRGEIVALRGRPRFADRVPDPNFPETPEPADPSRGDRRALDGRAAVEDADPSDFLLLITAELQPVPHRYRPREHADVSDLLPGRTTFDFENRARDRAMRLAFGGGQQLFDAGDQLIHALDCGDYQHGAVEHAQHPFHLGDEIRVARGVDQVDRDVVDDERYDGRLDRDATLSF